MLQSVLDLGGVQQSAEKMKEKKIYLNVGSWIVNTNKRSFVLFFVQVHGLWIFMADSVNLKGVLQKLSILCFMSCRKIHMDKGCMSAKRIIFYCIHDYNLDYRIYDCVI